MSHLDKDGSGDVGADEFVEFLDGTAGDLVSTPRTERRPIVAIHMSPHATGGNYFDKTGWELVPGTGTKHSLYVWISRVRGHTAPQRDFVHWRD